MYFRFSLKSHWKQFQCVLLFCAFITVVSYLLFVNNFQTSIVYNKNGTVEEEMEFRLSVMRNACQIHGLDKINNDSLHLPNPWEYLINEEHKLVWCNVFKSGSTRPSVEKLLDAMNHSISFIVARNPFERLVSAYRDKIVNAVQNSYHHKLSKKIIQNFRLNRNRSKLPTNHPSFSEFVRYIINENLRHHTFDMHWQPVYKFCTPCQFKFTHIIKMETFDRDQYHILEKLEIQNLTGGLHKDNVGKGGQTSKDLTKSFLQELSPKLYENLVNIYKIDFDLFGYEIPAFEKI